MDEVKQLLVNRARAQLQQRKSTGGGGGEILANNRTESTDSHSKRPWSGLTRSRSTASLKCPSGVAASTPKLQHHRWNRSLDIDTNLQQIFDYLYLGDFDVAQSTPKLCQFGLECLVDATGIDPFNLPHPLRAEKQYQCHHIPRHTRSTLAVTLSPKSVLKDIFSQFDEINKFIHQARAVSTVGSRK